MKQQSSTGYRVEEKTGYVKDQIGEWEKLFTCVTTDEQVIYVVKDCYWLWRIVEDCLGCCPVVLIPHYVDLDPVPRLFMFQTLMTYHHPHITLWSSPHTLSHHPHTIPNPLTPPCPLLPIHSSPLLIFLRLPSHPPFAPPHTPTHTHTAGHDCCRRLSSASPHPQRRGVQWNRGVVYSRGERRHHAVCRRNHAVVPVGRIGRCRSVVVDTTVDTTGT